MYIYWMPVNNCIRFTCNPEAFASGFQVSRICGHVLWTCICGHILIFPLCVLRLDDYSTKQILSYVCMSHQYLDPDKLEDMFL